MGKPGGVHIVNGPVFSAVVNGWGADCSCGWKTNHDFHGFVDWAVDRHRRVAGFGSKRWRDEKAVAGSNMKFCPACAEEVLASAVWCMFCGFGFDSA
jgi:hypothetical protein